MWSNYKQVTKQMGCLVTAFFVWSKGLCKVYDCVKYMIACDRIYVYDIRFAFNDTLCCNYVFVSGTTKRGKTRKYG